LGVAYETGVDEYFQALYRGGNVVGWRRSTRSWSWSTIIIIQGGPALLRLDIWIHIEIDIKDGGVLAKK